MRVLFVLFVFVLCVVVVVDVCRSLKVLLPPIGCKTEEEEEDDDDGDDDDVLATMTQCCRGRCTQHCNAEKNTRLTSLGSSCSAVSF